MKIRIAAALAATAVAATAFAAPPAQEDPLAASFERMLDHEPTPTAPIDLAALARLGVDPLHEAVHAALWQMEPASFHLDTRLAATSAAPR